MFIAPLLAPFDRCPIPYSYTDPIQEDFQLFKPWLFYPHYLYVSENVNRSKLILFVWKEWSCSMAFFYAALSILSFSWKIFIYSFSLQLSVFLFHFIYLFYHRYLERYNKERRKKCEVLLLRESVKSELGFNEVYSKDQENIHRTV